MTTPIRAKDPETGRFIKSETPPETPADETSAEDAINEERQRINDEQVSDFLGEEVKDGKVAEDEPEEKPEEEPEEKPEEEAPEVEEPEKKEEIDLEKVTKEITETVRKETQKEITEKLTQALGEKPTAEQKDKYEEYSDKFAKDKGRNPTWFELVPFIKDEIKAELKRDQEESFQKTESEKKQIAETNTKRQTAFDSYVDEQLNELHAAGKLDKNNKDVRNQLFTTMYEVNNARVKENKPPIYSVKEIFYEHYKSPTAQPAGDDAPISAGRGSTQTASEEDYSYNDIRSRSFLDMFKK